MFSIITLNVYYNYFYLNLSRDTDKVINLLIADPKAKVISEVPEVSNSLRDVLLPLIVSLHTKLLRHQEAHHTRHALLVGNHPIQFYYTVSLSNKDS